MAEVAAATVAGALSLADAARLVVQRSRAVAPIVGRGAMASLIAPVAEVEARLARFGGRLAVAAINSPRSVAVAGDPGAIAELLAECERTGIRARPIAAGYASHSPHIDAVRGDFLEAVGRIEPRPPEISFYSSVTGGRLDGRALDASYWYRNLREPVRFADATRALLADGITAVIEVSPHPVLGISVAETIEDTGRAGAVSVLATLRRKDAGLVRWLAALAEAHVLGAPVDWKAVLSPAPRVDLPTYPFQRRRFWPAHVDFARKADASGWRYQVVWKPVAGGAAALAGRWHLVVPPGASEHPVVRDTAAALTDHGAAVTMSSTAPDGEAAGILSLLALDEAPQPEHPGLARGLVHTLDLVRALDRSGSRAPLWLVSAGAVAAADGDRIDEPARARLWGIGRSIALEMPQLWGGLVDLPGGRAQLPERLDPGARAALVRALASTGGEDQVAIRGDRVLASRLVRATRAAASFAPTGAVLVIGDGPSVVPVARWLLGRGAERVILAGAGEDARAELGNRAALAVCDPTDASALAGAIERHGVTAVVDTAGLLEESSVDQLALDRLDRVIAAHAAPARAAHQATARPGGPTLVLFSSIAATFGGVGQAAYGAANAELDALAQHRRALGYPALSIAWGLWAGTEATALALRGVSPMAPWRALDELGAALGDTAAATVIADLAWDRFAPRYSEARRRPLIAELMPATDPLEPDRAGVPADLAALPPEAAEAALLALVTGAVATVLGHDGADVAPDRELGEVGFDSLRALELRNRLSRAVDRSLPITLALEHPTPRSLARALLARITREPNEETHP
jgi:acyl transferase domain-containing protein